MTFMTFHTIWECHHPNGRTPSFFRGVVLPPDEIFETSSNLQKLEMCCGGEPQSLVQLET